MFKSFSFLIILQRGLENISLNLQFFKGYLKKNHFQKDFNNQERVGHYIFAFSSTP